MTVTDGKVVAFGYHLKNSKGETIEKSTQPMEYIHGQNNIIPGLEKELKGLKVGDTKNVIVAPKEAYGEYINENVFDIPLANFPQDIKVEVGMQFTAHNDEGPVHVTIVEVKEGSAVADANHPLAGETLHFDVTIENIREATLQEKSHGHVHQHGHDH